MIPIAVSEIAAKAWKPIAAVLAVVIVLGAVWFYGYTHGQGSRQPEIDAINGKLATAQAQVEALGAAVTRQNAENDAARRQAELAKAYADAAIERAQKLENQRQADKAAFERQLAAAGKLPACAAAKEQICAAVPYPY